ncbi:hypothetical protein FVER53590_29937 [Fusarium verticillioides]|nr:hypothetical protein FVER53590_29937 [Fusarium verticillioides]
MRNRGRLLGKFYSVSTPVPTSVRSRVKSLPIPRYKSPSNPIQSIPFPYKPSFKYCIWAPTYSRARPRATS